jgi:hypothetical protein
MNSSETPILTTATILHLAEVSIRHSYSRENLKSHKALSG